MNSIFHREATSVEFRNSYHNSYFLEENIINLNKNFPTVVFNKKQEIQALTLKRALVQGNYYCRTLLVTTRSSCKAPLATHTTHLTTLSTHSTPLFTRSTSFSIRSSTRLFIRLSIRSTRLSTRNICLFTGSSRGTIHRSFCNLSKKSSPFCHSLK